MPNGVVITTLIGVFSLILFRIVSLLRGVMPIASANFHGQCVGRDILLSPYSLFTLSAMALRPEKRLDQVRDIFG
jgi:hypothetical protein